MGPSHTFFLLLVISAYALGMLPQGNMDFSTMMSNSGFGSMMSGSGFPGSMAPMSQAGSFGGSLTGGSLGMTGGSLDMAGGSLGMTGGSLGMAGGSLGMAGGSLGMTSNPMTGAGRGLTMRALQFPIYERKRKLLKNLIKLYENHGCVDPMQKFSTEYIPAAITMIGGCSNIRANISCRQYGIGKVNFQTVLMQNAMPATQQNLMAGRMQNMSPYNIFQDYILGTVPRGQMNPMKMRMVYGNEGPGSGLAFSGERLDMLKNWRIRFLPYQCQDIRMGSLEMGLCCPGPVSFDPRIEMGAMADLINV